MEFLIGADPELFVKDKRSKEFISGWGLIKGDKQNPYPVDDGAVQVDGMALEFNINPARTKTEFVRNIVSVKRQLSGMIGPDLSLVPTPTVHFSDKVWLNTPDEAAILGCDPDFNAWDGGRENNRPDGEVKFRTGAGHIHIGWTEGVNIDNPVHLDVCIALVQQLDATLGVWSVLKDEDTERRSLYGRAGAFRPKPYGVEYRVLSNFWTKNKTLMSEVYGITMNSIKLLQGGHMLSRRSIPNIVNGSEKNICQTYFNNYQRSVSRYIKG